MEKRVCIIGAGTAGLILAKSLASNGIEVDIFEGKKTIEQDHAKASGILSKTGLQELGINYKEAIVNSLRGAYIYGNKNSMRICAQNTMAYVLDRGHLARILMDDAISAGASIYLGKKIDRQKITSLASKYSVLVGADGAVSNVASAFQFPPIEKHILTYKAEYEGLDIKEKYMVSVHFNNQISKKFFGWTVPYSNSVMEVGIGTFSKSGSSKKAYESFIKTQRIQNQINGNKPLQEHASIIPLMVRKKTVMENVLLVGDAAGQVKATTGGGIIFGGICAKQAASSISAYINSAVPLANYEKTWRKINGRDLTYHRLVHAYYSILGNRSVDFSLAIGRIIGLESLFSKYGDMDRPTRTIKRILTRDLNKQ